jgi:hypothetical protein
MSIQPQENVLMITNNLKICQNLFKDRVKL